MKIELGTSWGRELAAELAKSYFFDLQAFLASETGVIYPPERSVFNAFLQTPFEKVRVVIVGQDPYHSQGQAEGLCFSVSAGVPFPPSLRNIFLELQSDVGVPPPRSGSLLPWAKQGVFLLNAVLTVQDSQPLSHAGKGWERFTDAVIERLLLRADPVVFVLWGQAAKNKLELLKTIGQGQHVFLTAAHPSPFSAHKGFLGCRHFSKINQFLAQRGSVPILWAL